ncbi:hypothetical protein MTO96_016608 [Rhipicephalus appendiculatus]
MSSAFIQPPPHFQPGDDPLNRMGGMAGSLHHIRTSTFPVDPAADTDDADPVQYILDKLDELYCPYKNVIQAAALFNSMVQKPADWSETVSVNGQKVTFKLDTGSDVNIIPEEIFTQWTRADQQQSQRQQKSLPAVGNSFR